MSYGQQWSAWAFVQRSAEDFSDVSTATTVVQESDEISLEGKTSCEIGIDVEEKSAASPTGNVRVLIAGYGATGWTDEDEGAHVVHEIVAVASTKVHANVMVDAMRHGSFKVLIDNGSDQTLHVSVKIRTAVFGENT